MSYFHLFIAELKRRWSLVLAYPVEEIVGTIVLAVLFYMIFLGAGYMAGPTAQFGGRLENVIVGYVVWILLMNTYGNIAHNVEDERTKHTLEQLMMSNYGLRTILFVRTLADITITLLQTAAVTVIITLLTHTTLHFTLAAVLPVLTVLLASIGLGFMIGALSFALKKITALLMVIQFAVLFIVIAPVEKWGPVGLWLGSLLPVSPSSAALRSILVAQKFDWELCLLGLANAAFYLLVGLAIFKAAENFAKRRGTIGTF
jgi:ABC-2 type transport system permease protein